MIISIHIIRKSLLGHEDLVSVKLFVSFCNEFELP